MKEELIMDPINVGVKYSHALQWLYSKECGIKADTIEQVILFIENLNSRETVEQVVLFIEKLKKKGWAKGYGDEHYCPICAKLNK